MEQQGEVITIRGDEEDYYSQEGDEDDDAWHRARRRGSDDESSGDSAPAPRSGTDPVSTESEHNRHADPKPTGGQDLMNIEPMAGGPQAKAKRGKKKSKRRKKGPKQTDGHPATTGQQTTTEPNTDSRSNPLAAADAGDVASVSTSTVPTERAPSGQIQGRPGGRGRERGRAERRGMTPQVIERFCAELKQQPSELVVTKLAEKLYERKKDKISKILTVLGVERTLDLFSETMARERQGGMMIPASGPGKKEGEQRRRSSGGVFLTLLKERATKPELALINEEETKLKRSTRKRKRGTGGAAAAAAATTDEGISTSRIRADDDAGQEDNCDDEEGGRSKVRDFEVIEAQPSSQAEAELPDRTTLEVRRQLQKKNQQKKNYRRGKRPKRTDDSLGAIVVPQAGAAADDNPFGAVW